MERLLRVPDIMERYQCNRVTAAKYIRKMVHMENPLAVTVSALEQWERSRTCDPGRTAPAKKPRYQRAEPGEWRMPRERSKA